MNIAIRKPLSKIKDLKAAAISVCRFCRICVAEMSVNKEGFEVKQGLIYNIIYK